MVAEFFAQLSSWQSFDTWIVITAALASMACALPGAFLVLRRQSMMGDALSHTMLLGIVCGYLFAWRALQAGWIPTESYPFWRHAAIFVGAIAVGLFSALLTQLVEKLGRVEPSAALGVVFTTLFALGLVTLRIQVDAVDLDPDCVLYGTIETVTIDTVAGTDVPVAAVVCGAVLVVNLLFSCLFFKELKISTFDPQMSTAQGIPASWMQYAVMGLTALTLVAAFESVGSILVIAMLIVPAATASMITDRLGTLLVLSLVVATLAAVGGHILAITTPAIIFSRLGHPLVQDASTAGMMAVAVGLILAMTVIVAPRYGILGRVLNRWRLGVRIVREDVLGFLYRSEETKLGAISLRSLQATLGSPWLRLRVALWQLGRRQLIAEQRANYELTEQGRNSARELVRSHRLWESYMARHFQVPSDHLHPSAERVEHFIDGEFRRELAVELEQPDIDPHGQNIPVETDETSPPTTEPPATRSE